MKIKGHALVREGAAFDMHGMPAWHGTTAGTGRAMCECGALSEELPSGAARRQWHRREHKPSVAVKP